MIEFALINKILIIFINIVAVWIGIATYQHDKKILNRIIPLMVIAMLCWVDFAYLARRIGTGNIHLASAFLKIAWFVTPLLFTLLYFLVIYLLEKAEEFSLLNKLVFVAGAGSAFLTGFTGYVIQDITFVDGSLSIIYGSLMYPFFVIVTFLIISTLYPLFVNYFKVSEKKQKKVQYFLIGILIFYLANIIFNIVLPVWFKVTNLYWIGDYSSIFLIGFTALAIVKRELFGIKVVAIELLVALLGIILFTLPFLMPTPTLRWVTSFIFILYSIFGYYLIKAALKEAERRKRAEEIAEEAKRLNKLKNQFLVSTQHHLRTPLSAIQGYLSLMREGTYGEIPEEADQKLERSLRLTKELIKLANDFLDVAQFNIGGKSFKREDTNLNELIEEIIEELTSEVEKKGIELKFDKFEKPVIKSDYPKLKEALYNVVNNAIKYTKEGSVKVIGEVKNGLAIIKVEDTGIGMTEEELEKLFQHSFERGERAKKTNVTGRGVGLFISSQIIAGLGGTLTADSEGKGKGSTFTAKLPVDGGK